MKNINDKINDGGATADGRLDATEYNDHKNELQNAVARSGQTLTPGAGDNTLQLAEALFLNGVKAEAFQDVGAANSYDLRPISGASGVKVPTSYAALAGAIVTFKPANTNTGASTLNLGQTAGIGAKPLTLTDGTPLSGGEVDAAQVVQCQYNATADRWELLPWSLPDQNITLPLAVNQGGTGSTTATGARTNLGVPPTTRAINTGGLLSGGGDLSADRTLIVPASSQAQAEAGTDNTTAMTPLRVAQAIAALGGGAPTSVQAFTTPGAATWNKPAGVKSIIVIATGGGGAGGGTDFLNAVSGGGGSGATSISILNVSAISSLSIVVGAGGQFSFSSSPGEDGEVTTVSNGATVIASAPGGIGAPRGTQVGSVSSNRASVVVWEQGGAPAPAGVGDITIPGAPGGKGSIELVFNLVVDTTTSNTAQPVERSSSFSVYTNGGDGAPSFWGGGGKGSSYRSFEDTVLPGTKSDAPGAGGGGWGRGSISSAGGTDGADGAVFILEFS